STIRVLMHCGDRSSLTATSVPLRPPPTIKIVRAEVMIPVSLADRRYQASNGAVTKRCDRRQRLGGGRSAFSGLLDDQSVAGARSRLQELRRGGVGFDLLPQPVHKLLQQLPVCRVPMAPHLDEKAVRAHRMACV